MDKVNSKSYLSDVRSAASMQLPWNDLEGKNILVVGATGLIGGTVVDILMSRKEAEYNVYACGRNEQRASLRFQEWNNDHRFHFLKQDITQSINSGIQFDYIIDAASGASPKIFNSDPVGVMRSNILGVDHLLSYGIGHGIKKFVYVSSGEVYGEGDGRAFGEDYSGFVDTLDYRSCYPTSKRAAETLCASYQHQYGLHFSIARPSHVYGPYFTESDNRVYAQFIRNVLRHENIIMKSDGKKFRSWCYVVDCASAILFILLKGENGKAYNIADESSNKTIRELAEMTAKIGHSQVVMQIPADNINSGGTPITKAVFDTTRLQSLGWQINGTMEDKLSSTIQEARRWLTSRELL